MMPNQDPNVANCRKGARMTERKVRLLELLGQSPRLIALVGMFAWLALLWFMLRDVL